MRTTARVLAWIGGVLLTLLVLVIGAALWVVNTRPGTTWAAHRAEALLGGKLVLREVDGTIAGPLTVQGFRYHDPESGLDARAEYVRIEAALTALLFRRAHVQSLEARGIDVRLPMPREEEERKPFSLKPPLDVVLDALSVEGARIERSGRELLQVRTASAAGAWTQEELRIDRFALDSPQGHVELAGEVSERETYDGQASGQFRWQLGEAHYAGELKARSERGDVTLDLQLSAPTNANLIATLSQRDTLPWTFAIEVPAFDPRERLPMPASIRALAASLRGEGDREVAEIRGDVELNGQPVRIAPLRVRAELPVIHLETLTLVDPQGKGRLTSIGEIRLPERERVQPLSADIRAHWEDVQLPKEWVGQVLATRGDLAAKGSFEAFEVGGRFSLGPPERLADIAIGITGTPDRVDIGRLSIVQPEGELTSTGHVLLRPALSWKLQARARRFDPGAFVADWPGRLNFALDTEGHLNDEGPSARLGLTRLDGRLRGRQVSGAAALTLSPERVIAGSLRVSSGASVVRLTGQQGEALDVLARVDIASLEDWVPQATGALNGRFRVTGRWPEIEVEAQASGRKLAYGTSSLRAVELNADVANPQQPQGTVRISGRDVSVAGFGFSSVQIEAEGDQAAHTAYLRARGDPVSTELRLQGSRDGERWQGTVSQLMIGATGIAELALRQPAQVRISPQTFSISESCLADERTSLCVAAARDEAGELNASYVLEHVPLGLLASLARPDLPVQIEAVAEGRGNIRRTAAGELFGEISFGSPSGRISGEDVPAEEGAADALLSYEDLQFRATMSGDSAHASAGAAISGGDDGAEDGRIEADLSVYGLASAAPALNGSARLTIPDLAPVELFVPQLVALGGHGEATVQIGGTTASPRITGQAQLSALGAEVPVLGLALHDGAVRAEIAEDRTVAIEGQISSGDGTVSFTGGTDGARALKLDIQGKDFLAADIPGAHVIVSPELVFTRSAQRMDLTGNVQVPLAEVDLTKLPQNTAPRASPDVVVIDDEDPAEQARELPLHARVTFILGKKVTLVGFGLDATLDGKLTVIEAPGDPTTGSGEIRVAGTYKAYGQDLTIEQGRLLFAATPIQNPQLNIVAARKLPDVTARLRVTGTASDPVLEVFSDPPLPQTQALSYLVTGKPLSEIGSGEGDLVTSAARSLGGAAGNLLAKSIGNRLGIDEIGISESRELGGEAFTVGEYLSPRLYVSYGVGLFEPGEVVTLRYRLSDRLSIEASQGPLNQRAGINLRIER